MALKVPVLETSQELKIGRDTCDSFKMLLQGRNAVITGGASGIGFATAEEFLKNGVAKVLLLDLGATLDPAKEAQLKACNPDATVFYAQCDVTRKQQLEKVLRQDAIQCMGSVDILVNCAGIFNESDPEKCIATNLCALINCSMIALDLMTKEKSGNNGRTIVNISSVLGLAPATLGPTYSATKYGVIGFTRALGTEEVFNTTGVKMVAICPGKTSTDLYHNAKDTKLPFPWMRKCRQRGWQTSDFQSPNAVGKAIIKAILEGETGSLWLTAEDKVSEVHIEVNPPNELLSFSP